MAVRVEGVVLAVGAESAWAWMCRRYLGQAAVCGRCGSSITGVRALASFRACRRTFCSSCGTRFNPAEGTPISGTTWLPEQYVQLLILRSAGFSVREIAEELGKSESSTRDMIDRAQLLHGVNFNLLLSGSVSTGIKRAGAAEGAGLVVSGGLL